MRLPLLSRTPAHPALALCAIAGITLGGNCPAHADAPPPGVAPAPHPHAYAVLVGDNQGGPGQTPLQFAETDAGSMANVLRELGHYDRDDVHVLLHPDAAQVLAALDEVAAKTRADASRGEQSEVVFYYSGHARASAVNLGGEELPLTTLRQRLTALPTTLTLVVLDACQSGSFSRIKGAEPAADFTYNSVAHLQQKGLAVMASSTSEELSQESDELKSSYFTHHLVTALRGAGDADGDGRVSLDEAYKYAYRRTLASTARTQVGEQHVTLETDLAGQGDVAVTFPAEARAQLEIPGILEGRVLVQQHSNGAVVAEVQKVAGPPLRLALIAGIYDAIVGQKTEIVQCRVTVLDDQVSVLDTSSCTKVTPEETASKGHGKHPKPLRERDRWAVEGAFGFIGRETDGYNQRLQTFGYQRQTGFIDLPSGRFTLGVSREFTRHIAGLFQVGTLTGDSYARTVGNETDTASFKAYGGAMYVRAQTDVLEDVLGIYGQAGVGMSVGTLDYSTTQTGVPPTSSNMYLGYLLSSDIGMTVRLPSLVTFFLQAGYDRAPAITNLIGDTHDSGGFSAVTGVRFRFGDNR